MNLHRSHAWKVNALSCVDRLRNKTIARVARSHIITELIYSITERKTVRPVSSPCSEEIMPWLPRKQCGRLMLVVSSISFVFITVINYNVLKELPTDSNYWSRTNIKGS